MGRTRNETKTIAMSMTTNPSDEHNPDNLTPEQYGAPEWRLLRKDEFGNLSECDIQGIERRMGSSWIPFYSSWFSFVTYRRRVSVPATGGEKPIAGVGSRIVFLADLEEGPTDEHPYRLYAKKGDGGVITEVGGCKEGYWVKWDAWQRAAFGAELGKDFELISTPTPEPAMPEGGLTFQSRVLPWLLACFGQEIADDKQERNHRFCEEALELVQSTGCTQSEAMQLVEYVYNRPPGIPNQEVGGVMVTLAALCLAQGLDMHHAGEQELNRIWTKVEKIRAKQAAKPKYSPLPEVVESSELASLRQRLTAVERERDEAKRRVFPIMGGPTIPWALIAPHERQALQNHGNQSLEKLASRGGLGCCEAVAILEDRQWRAMDKDAARNRLIELRDTNLRAKLTTAETALAEALRREEGLKPALRALMAKMDADGAHQAAFDLGELISKLK
jgi:hypothetical protein